MKLNEGRTIRNSTIKVFRYAMLVSTVVFIGYISSLPLFTGYFDTTRFKKNTLTANSQNLINQLKRPVSITTYTNVANAYAHLGSAKLRNFDLSHFEQYRRYLPGLKMDYIAYYDTTMRKNDPTKTLEEKAQRAATAYGYDFNDLLSPKEIKKQINLVPENNFFVRTLNYNGKKVFLRMYFDIEGYPSEAEISAALKKLLTKPAYIGILDNNDERSISRAADNAYQDFLNVNNSRYSLINQGFELRSINMKDSTAIPDSLTVLLITDPITPYSATETTKIINYINKGGNVFIAAEPGRQKELNKILSVVGVQLTDGNLLQQSKNFEIDLLQTHLSAKSKVLGFDLKKDAIITMPGAVGITFVPKPLYNYIPLLLTNKKQVWNSLAFSTAKPASSFAFDSNKDNKIQATTALAITRIVNGKTQKIFVSGDADFMSNVELKRNNVKTENTKFTMKLFNWLSDGEYPIDTSRPPDADKQILATKSQISLIKTFFLMVLPLTLAILGSFILLRRRRK
jgi:ABC-2 type transport system permease protein